VLLNFIKARLLAPPPRGGLAIGCAAAAVALPTLLRLAIDPIVADVAYVTYYPFVLIVAMFMGWGYAAGVALAATLVANYLFLSPRYTVFAGLGDTVGSIAFLLCAGLLIAIGVLLRQTMGRVEAGLKREAFLNAELHHRVANTITVVQALATLRFRGVPAADSAVRDFTSRLGALAAAQDVLTGGGWEICKMPDLATRALAPFGSKARLRLTGPACSLPKASCVPLVLALHELGTNAVKYGALSTPSGRVEVAWRVQRDPEGADELHLQWTERGGPLVQPPTRQGLGSRLLAAQPGLKAVRMHFKPEGAACEILVAGAQLDERPRL
jgi:two-component sensor histidine kinase